MNMASSTFTDVNPTTSNNLEAECHYLSQALTKLKRRSPEWSYLHQRLEAAEEELDAMRTDLREMEMETVHFQYPPPPLPTDGHAQTDEEFANDDGTCDMGAIDSDLPDIRSPLHDNYDDDASCQPFIFCIPNDDITTTTRRERIRLYISWGMKVATLIAGILLVACNIKRHPISSAANNDEGSTLSSSPVPSNQWDIDFSSFLSNIEPHEGPCASFTMHLVTDQYGNETSWELISIGDSSIGKRNTPIEESYLRKRTRVVSSSPSPKTTVVLKSGGPYYYQDFDSDGTTVGHNRRAIIAKTCLPVGSYKFVLHDAQRDGICCDYGRGEYGLNLSKGRVVRPLSSGSFLGENEFTSFQVTEDDIDILPDNESIDESSTLSAPTVVTNVSVIPNFI